MIDLIATILKLIILKSKAIFKEHLSKGLLTERNRPGADTISIRVTNQDEERSAGVDDDEAHLLGARLEAKF
jgi:hypothetical protein